MKFAPPPALIRRREAITSGLMDFNRWFMDIYENLYLLQCFLENHMEKELENLDSSMDDDSKIYEDILDHFQYLNERFFEDLRRCFNNFRADSEWLTDNMYAFDPLQMDIWGTLSDQAHEYRDILGRMFNRCMNFHLMFIDVLAKQETFNHDHL